MRGIALLGLPLAACSLLVDTDVDVRSDAGSPADADPLRRLADSAVLIARTIDAQIRFSDDPDGPGSCLSEVVAGCEIQTCIGGEHPLPRPDAGVVQVSSAAGEVSYSPDEDGLYPTQPAATWEEGDAVTIMASGGQVPAFTEVLTGPGDIESVVVPPAGELIIARDQPLAVEWTGADSLAAAAIVCDGPPRVQLRCPFPDGLSAEIPAAAIERLPTCSGQLFVFTEDRRLVEAGASWVVRVAVRGQGYTAAATVE